VFIAPPRSSSFPSTYAPEIMLLAFAKGMRVIEVPMTFTQHREGKSKLYPVETGGSYLRLTRHLSKRHRT
jgi:hypothetical protein